MAVRQNPMQDRGGRIRVPASLRRMKPSTRRLIGIWLAWTAAGVFFATQDFMTRLYRSESFPWLPLFAGWMTAMYICAAFTPLILWLGQRWPLERGHLFRHVVLHIFFGVAFSIVANVLEGPLLMALHILPTGEGHSLRSTISLLLVYGFHGGVVRYWVVLAVQAILREQEKVKA